MRPASVHVHGLTWLEADETVLLEHLEGWAALKAVWNSEHGDADAAVQTMLATNNGPAVEAFTTYWAKVGGGSGHLADGLTLITAEDVAAVLASGYVLELKLLVIGQLIAAAAIIVAAAALAVETLGTSLAEAAALLWDIHVTIERIVEESIALIAALGQTVGAVVDQTLAKRVEGLKSRPIHVTARSMERTFRLRTSRPTCTTGGGTGRAERTKVNRGRHIQRRSVERHCSRGGVTVDA